MEKGRKGPTYLSIRSQVCDEDSQRIVVWVKENLRSGRSKSAGFNGECKCSNMKGSWKAESVAEKYFC